MDNENNYQLLIVNYQLTKWFAVSKTDVSSVKVLDKIKTLTHDLKGWEGWP